MFGQVMLAKLEVKEGSPAQRGADDDVSAMASVAAVRSSAWNKLLPPEADATAAAVAGFDKDLCLVDKFHAAFLPLSSGERMEKIWSGLPRGECVNASFSCATEKQEVFSGEGTAAVLSRRDALFEGIKEDAHLGFGHVKS